MKTKSILFVCMGNICRSPAAEGVMRHQLREAGLDKDIVVDSAGTINYHMGNAPDARMIRTAAKRGITLEHCARQIMVSDLDNFDLILVMDEDNYNNVIKLDASGANRAKIQRFCDYCTEHSHTSVPDPYYGEQDGFDLVLDLLNDGCAELVRRLQSKTNPL